MDFPPAQDLNQILLHRSIQRRFTTGAAGVYSKAMLVAFIYDLIFVSE